MAPVLYRWLFVAVVIIGTAGCGDEPQTNGKVESAAAQPPMTARQMQQWAASCALCHAAGEAGAPVVGNAQQWQPRLEQGRDVLLTHTLEGYNSMPPLGYCMSCETGDFVAMIDFMLEGTH